MKKIIILTFSIYTFLMGQTVFSSKTNAIIGVNIFTEDIAQTKLQSLQITTDREIDYDTEEYFDPFSLTINIKNAVWEKGRYVKNLDAPPLYRYVVTENVNKNDPYLATVKLYFKEPVHYTITQIDTQLIVSWQKEYIPEEVFADIYSPLDERITIKFTNTAVLDVVRLIGTKAKLNMVITATSDARTTLDIKDVKISDALNYIIGPSNIKWFFTDDILVVTNAASVQGLLDYKVFTLNYSDGNKLVEYIQPALSDNGQIIPIVSSSAPDASGSVADRIMVIDTGQSLRKVANIIRELDKKEKQINIAVKFIETSLKNTERLGINWQMRTNVGFPAIIDTSSSVLGVGHLMENYNVTQLELPVVQAILEALETDADAKILQEPQVTTFNNVEASVMIGTSIPVLVPQGQGSVFGTNPYTYETQDINISLSVTPRVNEEGYISIKLNTSVQAIVAYVGPEADRPVTSNRTVNTNVMVKDGETLLIGGLIFENNTHSRSQFPILGNIPLLNLLFRSKVDDVEQRELLIFITPSVVG